MDKKLVKLLVEIGLDIKEAKIYLALLALGEGTVQEIAQKTGLKRTGLYPLLDELKKKKLVLEAKSKKRTYFVAEDPAEILEHTKSRVEQFAKNLELLNALRNKTAKKPRVLFLNGAE